MIKWRAELPFLTTTIHPPLNRTTLPDWSVCVIRKAVQHTLTHIVGILCVMKRAPETPCIILLMYIQGNIYIEIRP